MTSVLGSASTTVLGLVSALVMWLGGHSVLNHTWSVGDYFAYNMFLAFMIAPVFQIAVSYTHLDVYKRQELAVGEGAAQRLHLGVGSAVELEVGGVVRALRVAAIYRADGQHLGARVAFVLPSGQLKNEPATWYGGAHIDPKQIAAMERALFAAYPTVSVINVAAVSYTHLNTSLSRP